jgi:hypothetical protein
VGIRTDNPQGLLHVDAKADTDAGQNTGIDDDVVFTADGRIGVGTLSPQARLDIRSSTPGAIRIADGTEGGGRILVSDIDGRAQWQSLLGSWYATLRGGSASQWKDPFTYTFSDLSPPNRGSVDLAAGSVAVPYTGLYLLTFSGTTDPAGTSGYTFYLSYVDIWINGVTNVAFAQQIHRSLPVEIEFSGRMFFSLKKDDIVIAKPHPGSSSPGGYHAYVYRDFMMRIDFIR